MERLVLQLSVHCTSSFLHPGNSLGRWVISFLLRSRHGDERALAERIKSCALQKLVIAILVSMVTVACVQN